MSGSAFQPDAFALVRLESLTYVDGVVIVDPYYGRRRPRFE